MIKFQNEKQTLYKLQWLKCLNVYINLQDDHRAVLFKISNEHNFKVF